MASTFADRIKQAANDFPGAHSTAWVQYLVSGSDVSVRMQAPEIMKEFRGNVKFGVDPKGILFFKRSEDLDIIGNIKIRNRRFTVSGTKVVAESEFGSPGGTEFHAFARFVAEVDTAVYPIPVFDFSKIGTGQMKAFDAVTCHITLSRQSDDFTVNLGTNTILKQAYFTSKAKTSLSQAGVLFFPILSNLKTKPNGREFCVADYSQDRIVFHIENGPNDVVALFLPNKPITGIGSETGKPRVTWEDIDP
ncbi:hypothetical protein AX14_007894 [Amanita brunnescens Koide BX004]|nr:hypothetical protein AX14_007894 [Amanita brunnescens Koide BX004]